MKGLNGKLLITLFLSALAVYGTGMFIGLMNADAAQYASMSREMAEHGSYLIVREHLGHYLDKPPFLLWLSALSFRIFGISDLAYRIPSFLFTLLGLYSTFRLGRLLYNKKVGIYASLLLITCQAWFLINHDIRTDTILAASVIFSIWQIYEYTLTDRLLNFFLGFAGIAVSMLTKGPIGIMVPVLALGSHFLIKRDWKNIFRWQWLAGLIVVLVLLLPMLWGLYMHSEAYPDNPLYQKDKYYALRFYFWIQSFGRITGESSWHNAHDPFFFVHTFIWSFFPWAFITFTGIYLALRNLFRIRKDKNPDREWITLAGVLLVIIAFSFSKYVLPHYIYVIFPLAAILTGSVIDEILGKIRVLTRTIVWIQAVCVGVTFIAGFLILTVVFPSHSILLWTAYCATLLLSLLFMRVTGSFEIRIIVPSVIAIVGFNLILNTHFYPELIKYQSDIRAAEVISNGTIPRERVYAFNIIRYSFEYKTGKYELPVRDTATLSRLIREKDVWIFTDRANIGVVRSINPVPVEEYEFDDYPVTRLKGKFLNAGTRSQAVSKAYLLRY